MEIVVTPHARERLQRRMLEWHWVEAAIRHPDWWVPDPVDASLERRFRVIPEMGNRVLRVVVCPLPSEACRLVTAFFDREARVPTK